MKLSELVEKYIQLRDKKARMKAEFDAQLAPVETLMDKIESKLLETFNSTGMTQIKTGAGTAYESTRTSASVADKEAFLEYVKVKDEWSLLDIRASKIAVEQFVAANEELPPGINWRAERVVNVRRAAS